MKMRPFPWRLIGNLRISRKYLLVLALVITSVIGSGFYSYQQYKSIGLRERRVNVEKDFQQVYEMLDEMSMRLLHMTTLLQSNEAVNRILATDATSTPATQQIGDQRPILQLLRTMQDGTGHYACLLYVDDSLLMANRRDVLFPIGDYRDELWMQKALTGWGWTSFETSQSLRAPGVVAIIRPIRSLDNYKKLLAVLRIDIKLSMIQHLLRQSTANGAYTYIESPDGELVAVSDEALYERVDLQQLIGPLPTGPAAYERRHFRDAERFIVHQVLSDSQWRLITVAKEAALMQGIAPMFAKFSVTSCVFVLMGMLLAYGVLSFISREVRTLHAHTEAVARGDLASRLPVLYTDEIGQLMQAHNHMLDRIQVLIADQKQREIERRNLELAALQSQVNPHFLYNTLEMIAWMAKLNMPENIGEVILNLTRFYKLSLSNGHDVIPLSSELQMIEGYMSIQRHRFKQSVQFQIDVPSEMLFMLLPKITLHPIVENALIHGIFEKPGGTGSIRVSGYIDERNMAVLQVTDDGIGLSRARFDACLSSDRREPKTGSYGLYNVERRLCLFFGLSSALTLDQSDDEHTIIRMTLPFREV